MATENHYALLVRISARKGMGDEFEALMRNLLVNLAAEECFVSFNLYRDPRDRDQFLFYELWTDETRYMKIRDREYFQIYFKERVALIEEKVERETWTLEISTSITPSP